MIPEPRDAEDSARRVRRGCTFVAVTFVALTVLFVSATGNLFFLTLLIFAVIALAFARLTQ